MGWIEDKAAAEAAFKAKAAQNATATAQNICPTCGASGSDPCVTPSGKVKGAPHSKRGS